MDAEQTVRELLEKAEYLEFQAEEFRHQAAKLREAAAIIGQFSANGSDRRSKIASKSPAEAPDISQRDLVASTLSENFKSIAEISEATGLERRQVSRALYNLKSKLERRLRRDRQPEYRALSPQDSTK